MLLGTRPIFAAYIQPSGIKSTNAAYTEPAGIRNTSASLTQRSTGPLYLLVYHLLSASYLPVATLTTSISHDRELLNLAKIYTNDTKYSGGNDNFT